MTNHKKLIIIGGGPAGLSAAVSAYDNGISADDILVLERDSEAGGILNQCIHAGFGLHRFGEELSGPEYAGRYIKMAEERGIHVTTNAMALSVSKDKAVTFVSPETGYTAVTADAVILAMGCRERTRAEHSRNPSLGCLHCRLRSEIHQHRRLHARQKGSNSRLGRHRTYYGSPNDP